MISLVASKKVRLEKRGEKGAGKSRDFLVPGPSGYLGPVPSRPGTFPGLPGT